MSIQKSLTDTTRIEPLTSVERMLFHIDPEHSLGLTVTAQRQVQAWIHSVSANVKRYLDKEIFIKDRTEYFDTIYDKYEYKTYTSPIWSITSISTDQSGEFDGTETTVHPDSYFIGTDQDTVVMDDIAFVNAKRALKIVYSAGMAYHPVNSIYDIDNNFTPGNYVIADLSGAMGKVISTDASSVTIEVLTGVFYIDDTLTEYQDLTNQIATGETGQIDGIESRALCESYPDIVEATEMQIRYMQQHRDDFENSGTSREGETIRRSDRSPAMLQAEVRMMLDPYRRLTMLA